MTLEEESLELEKEIMKLVGRKHIVDEKIKKLKKDERKSYIGKIFTDGNVYVKCMKISTYENDIECRELYFRKNSTTIVNISEESHYSISELCKMKLVDRNDLDNIINQVVEIITKFM